MNTDIPEDLAAQIAQAAASASGEPETAFAPGGAGHRCDVLIVDDTGTSRELLAAILRNFAGQLQLREARNGADALQIWHESNPRVTLLDIDMPDMDGLAVLKSMRQARPNTFVAMISGTNSIDHVRDALALGASGFVVKPYKPKRILDLLDKYGEQSGHTLTS